MVVIGSAGVGYFDAGAWPGRATSSSPSACWPSSVWLVIENVSPVWIRTGLVGLGLGAYLMGLVWPYILALPGTGPRR